MELPAALRQPPPVLPTELRRALSESSALSPAGHGVHVTPRAGLHLLDETAAATATMLDALKPECSQCDELRRQQKTAATVLHAATGHVADIQVPPPYNLSNCGFFLAFGLPGFQPIIL